MTGQDPGEQRKRFEYLFEPLPAEPTVAEGQREAAPPMRRGTGRSALLPAATVLGALLGVFLVWPDPVDAVPAPASELPVAPRLTSPPQAPPGVVEPPSAAEAPPPAPASRVPAWQTPSPQVPVRGSTAPSSNRRPPSPTVRAPMSVSPEPRPPFPNQAPQDGDDGPGGLLGGRLPGPL